MGKKYPLSLMIFRRDLRLEDNSALIQAIKKSDCVIPCFIFDPCQVEKENSYRSMNAIQFMIESLQDLQAQLVRNRGQLYIFYGSVQDVVAQLLDLLPVQAIFVNQDYTPFSTKRDADLFDLCSKKGVAFETSFDLLLSDPATILTGQGSIYKKFTPFCKIASARAVLAVQALPKPVWYAKKIATSCNHSTVFKKVMNGYHNKDLWVNGGRLQALVELDNLKNYKKYQTTHDVPSLATTNFSAHLKYGTISVRELYYAIINVLGINHPLLRQLYWRDFFTYIAMHSPTVFGRAYNQKYDALVWNNNKAVFQKWCKGQTGFPIVDAGMRQLNSTGFMHNRVRMIVASFLVKDLHIDWRWGERYFAQQLVDYDPAVNNGNWQWSASTGCDAQPYFRIFNPWLQQKKYDPDCVYIKRWVPELKNSDSKLIHSWYKPTSQIIKNYPRPIVNHAIEAAYSKKIFRSV